ncbi:MAG: polyprenyl synthetase family protein [Betaproteobacteria bacterium]|jgi:farnesyl-diphosphate synthase (EC 2.5.1.10)|nr:polyprenyl synthetase family protein [Betaproteobacteria bacterium]
MHDTPSSFTTWVAQQRQELENFLEQRMPPVNQIPHGLHQAMRYATIGGGKRLRALLTLATAEMVQADHQTALLVASSLELIHAYSLIHDDLPSMDNDSLRRGKPTCHVQFGEATAVLAGDALQSLAFQWLSEPTSGMPSASALTQVRLLAIASGSRGMAGGQAIDLASVGMPLSLPELEAMHLKKTGALIRAAILMGTHCGGASLSDNEQQSLTHFANRLGLLYQIVDDILDNTSDSATLGKTPGKDDAECKATYVTLLGLSEARSKAQEVLNEALDTLSRLSHDSQHLQALTQQIYARHH